MQLKLKVQTIEVLKLKEQMEQMNIENQQTGSLLKEQLFT